MLWNITSHLTSGKTLSQLTPAAHICHSFSIEIEKNLRKFTRQYTKREAITICKTHYSEHKISCAYLWPLIGGFNETAKKKKNEERRTAKYVSTEVDIMQAI